LFISALVTIIFLSGCDFISLDDVRNSNEANEDHKKSNENDESNSKHNKQNVDDKSHD